MYRILLFGGTTEGRELAHLLAARGVQVHLWVATEYGEALLPQQDRITVSQGRLDQVEIAAILRTDPVSCVVDATHPYAVQITENLRAACKATGTPYERLLRESTNTEPTGEIITVETATEAAAYCKKTEGKILLTTGSKELDCFIGIENYQERIYPRILPTVQAVERGISLGFSPAHLIAMQGPFSEACNLALFQQFDIRWLVTKESGQIGGFPEKIQAAAKAGVKTLVIGRPPQAEGHSFAQLVLLLEERFSLQPPLALERPAERFPLFVSLYGKTVQVFGGGKIAARRVEALLPFGCRVTVTAPDSLPILRQLAARGEIALHADSWKPGSCAADFVLAATDDRRVNHQIVEECHQKKIPTNAADCPGECDFFFPALIRENGLVIGLCSDGRDHTKVKNTAAAIRVTMRRLAEGEQSYHVKTNHTGREPRK